MVSDDFADALDEQGHNSLPGLVREEPRVGHDYGGICFCTMPLQEGIGVNVVAALAWR